MPLYLGSKRVNLYLNNEKYYLMTASDANELIPDNVLIDLNDYYLKDRNNIYLICLDDDNFIGQLLLTADNKFINTSNNKRLTLKKGE